MKGEFGPRMELSFPLLLSRDQFASFFVSVQWNREFFYLQGNGNWFGKSDSLRNRG